MNFNPIVLSIPIYFLLIGIELIIERFSRKKIYRLNDAVTNISCGITQQLTGIFFKVFTIAIYQFVFENYALFELDNSTWWYWVILALGVDFFYYWAHRMSHEINLFWGGHVVHHQSEDYNFSVALRQSTFQVLWTFMFFMPLALAGFNTLDFLLVSALNTVYQFWIHTETIGKLGWLEYIFNTPSHHRVHHGRDPKYIDKNHAGSLIIWDKMFGTFQEEEERPTYGITTPTNSWNPVWVNFNHYVGMWDSLKRIKGFGNKLKYIFYKPGWLPEELGGYQSAPSVDKNTYKKYDTDSSMSLNWYVLFQYLVALAGTALFLFNESTFNYIEKGAISAAIILTITNCGILFEGKKWGWYSEYIRIVLFSSVVAYISFGSSDMIMAAGSILFALISIGWLLSLRRKNNLATS